jgi:hypothetical protein
MVKRAGKKAGLPFQAHSPMIRHATGYLMANAGKDTRSSRAISVRRDTAHGALHRAFPDPV